MATIGVRVYKISLTHKGKYEPLPFNHSDVEVDPAQFISDFITERGQAAVDAEDGTSDRRWYFDPPVHAPSAGNAKGIIRYGQSGFESDLIDLRTRASNYKRKTTDIEMIPLFYEFWHPSPHDFILAFFQSFQGRSCINLLETAMKSSYQDLNPLLSLRIRKLMPAGLGGVYDQSPVKSLKLLRRNAPSDVAEKYLKTKVDGPIDFELTVKARRGGNLGRFAPLARRLSPTDGSVVEFDGVDFPDATADIKFGGGIRKVGVFGSSSDVGVIDLTDVVKRDSNGHPKFESISAESTKLLADFFKTVSQARRL